MKSLLDGRCESGLYPIKPSDVDALKHALVSRSTTHTQCMHVLDILHLK